MTTRLYSCHSPLGPITLASDGIFLTGLWFDGQKYFGATAGPSPVRDDGSLPAFAETVRWLDLYFSGVCPDFLPPLSIEALPGSAFRRSVWKILLTIPYGQTVTYGEIAARLAAQRTSASVHSVPGGSLARAVGTAVGHNPVSLVIPCHRVLGAGGKLTGYAGGLDRKEKLLALESGAYPF